MSQFSFDIVSVVDLQEVDNAVNQAKKEIATRFDFRGSKSSLDFDKNESLIRIIADDDLKLRNVHDILTSRFAARRISVKALDFQEPEKAFEGTLRQVVKLSQGIPQEKAKEIVRAIKETKLKVQATIQEDQVRVSAKSKDDLQQVIREIQSRDWKIPVQFTNYR